MKIGVLSEIIPKGDYPVANSKNIAYKDTTVEEAINENKAAIDNIVAATISPEMFGAVGDGETDDTAAVQTAFDKGGIISCNGKYRVTSTVFINRSYTTIQGSGMIIGDLEADGAILKCNPPNTDPLTIDHITIKDISITQVEGNTHKHTGILVGHEVTGNYGFMDVYIDGVSIENLTHRGIHLHGGTQSMSTARPYVTVTNSYINRCKGIGICQSRVISKIENCTVRLSGQENITIDNGCQQCMVVNNHLHLAQGGCGNIGIDQCNRCVITGNHIVNFDYDPEKSNDADNAIRLNCHTGDVTSLVFAGNTVIAGKYGVWIGSSERGYKGSGCIFSNNIFLNIGVSDFYFDNVSKCEVKGNVKSNTDLTTLIPNINEISTDIPLTLSLDGYIQEGYTLSTGHNNYLVIRDDTVFFTAKFKKQDAKTSGDVPFILPFILPESIDCLFHSGIQVCIRPDGRVQLYGDYVNIPADAIVQFSMYFPLTKNFE